MVEYFTKNLFDYEKHFTDTPSEGFFSYFIELIYCLPNRDKKIINDLHYFKAPHLLPKLLFLCLVKQMDIIIKDQTLQYKIADFLLSFEKFNPIVKDREQLIFISLILSLRDFDLAKNAYFQITKRCPIRDFWQWVVHEESDPDSGCFDADEQEPVEIRSVISLDCIDCIFPYFYRNLEDHPLCDYGFDPTDGVWKPLPYHKLECQEGDITQNYNLNTTSFVKVGPALDLWKHLVKEQHCFMMTDNRKLARDSSGCIYLAALPLDLCAILLVTIRHIYNFVYGSRDVLTGYNYVVISSPIIIELIFKILDNEDINQKNTFIHFLNIFKPALEQKFGLIIPDLK